MRLIVNGSPHDVADRITVAEVVRQLVADPAGVAVAVNGEVVTRGAWPVTRLREADRVEVLTAVQGG